jgi:hypothetical protein
VVGTNSRIFPMMSFGTKDTETGGSASPFIGAQA